MNTLDGQRFGVLVEGQYEDQELWYPVTRLREAEAEVWIVGPEAGKTYRSKHGYPAQSDHAAADVSAGELDGIIIPGGYAPDRMRRHSAMVELVRQINQAEKLIAAICHAGWMLCSADIVKGKRVTSFFAIKDDLRNAGADWIDQEVVRDGNLLTSRTPDDLPAFMRSIILAAVDSPAARVAERAQHAG